MKAVIMAGGEGTRLRPQTSNLPKPMLPLVGRPMMEHIVSLLRRHGITDIVVTVAFLPNAIRSYFGDGSELGVRMVYATEETPLGHGRFGAQRPRRAHGALLGDLGRRADRHRPHLDAAVPREEQRLGHAGAVRGGEPARVRHRDHPRGREHRALLGEAGLGAGLQRHHQHRHLRARARDLRSASPRGVPSTSRPRSSRPCSRRAGPIYGYVANGYWEDVGTTAAYLKAHEDILDGKVEVDISGFELQPGVWLGKGSSVDPAARLGGPGLHRRELHHRRARGDRGLHDHRRQHPHRRAGRGTPLGHRRELLRRPGGPGRGCGAGAFVRPAPGRPLRAGLGRGGGVPDRGTRRRPGRRQGLPLQGGRGRGAGADLHRVGVGRGPDAVRARGRAGHRQRRRQPRAGGAPGQGVGLLVRKRVGHHDLARHEPGGPGRSSAR